MTSKRSSRIARIAMALGGIAVATAFTGATDPTFPILGKSDQVAADTGCQTQNRDDIRVCVSTAEATAGVSVITVAPGLTVVQ